MGDSRRFSGEPGADVGIHQILKLAASHSIQEGQDEQTIKEKMGFSEIRNLRKIYIAQVTSLKVACGLPGGILFRTGRTNCRNQIRIKISKINKEL